MLVNLISIVIVGALLVFHAWPLPGVLVGEASYGQTMDNVIRRVFSYLANFFGMFSMTTVLLTGLLLGLVLGSFSMLLRLSEHTVLAVLYDVAIFAVFLRAGLQYNTSSPEQAAWHLFDNLLAPLFWYTIFGVLGCVMYSAVVIMRTRLDKLADPSALARAHGLLACIPMRLFCFTFALIGNFQETFELLVRQGFSLRMSNQSLLQETLYLQQSANAVKGGTLLDRAVLCWVVILILVCFIMI
jgi:hypothetical protein